MPNWCFNTLKVRGKKHAVDNFKIAAKDDTINPATDLSLAKLYPEPDYKKVKVKATFPGITKRKYARKGEEWWDWRVQHWGTKWEIEASIGQEKEYKNGSKLLIYSFDSAWSPPIEWLNKISADYPELKFELYYEEEGVGFKGKTTAIGGRVDDNCRQLY
jgi:hypothetical protein